VIGSNLLQCIRSLKPHWAWPFLAALTLLTGNPVFAKDPAKTSQSPTVKHPIQCDLERQHPESLQKEIARLLKALEEQPNGSTAGTPSPCWYLPEFLATLGHWLVQAGLYLEAIDYLERAILLNPELKGAQVDYARALSGSGDLPSGVAILSSLLQDPSLPTELAPSLRLAKQALEKGSWRGAGLASLTVGQDSNLLGAPNLSELALTVLGQTTVLPLAPSYMAKRGHYGQAELQYEAQKIELDGSQLTLYGNLRERLVPEFSQANFTQVNLVGEYSLPKTWGRTYFNYSFGGYQTTNESLHTANSMGVGGMFFPSRHCTFRLGMNGSLRRYNTNTILSGNYLGAQGIVGCTQPVYWQLIANLGQEIASNPSRPGGSQNQTSLRAISLLPLPVGQLLTDLQWANFTDLNQYSSFIESGRSRTMTQYHAKLEYQTTVFKDWQAALGYNKTRQISTLSLFSFENSGVYLALRYAW
jgi:tetratricopeptide (TPR) repeat protein